MRDDLPTPDELGEKLKRGEITKEEAIEVMSLRARRDAFAGLYAPIAPAGESAGPASAPQRRAWRVVGAVLAALVTGALLVLWLLWRRLD
jgi:hypothetical protein